ncbi:CAAX prenyl protease 1 [Scheffersomyces xylosifermentans]|uniref:CAAX prenyl protease 1 n=1 Tax=Scheffersomyces xylosifermentans TaxID=1304137 RepID=UPI00315D4FAE
MISLADSFTFLDNPSINWKYVAVSFTVGKYLFDNYIEYRQYQILNKPSPPASLKSEVTQETYDKSRSYSKDTIIWNFSGRLLVKSAPFLPGFMGGVITQSIFFYAATDIISTVLSLPFSYYRIFVLEQKFDFNKSTVGLWISDYFKWQAVKLILFSPFIAGFLKLIDHFGDSFIVYCMVFYAIAQLAIYTIVPNVISPLFNKHKPLEEGKLKTAIEDLAKTHNFPLDKLFVIDGSTRSSHSNAYFVGLPWSKRIVLYDTLIDQHTIEEIVAVLAHEIGHWKGNHIIKSIISGQPQIFLLCSSFSVFIHNKSLFTSFGFVGEQPVIIGYWLFDEIYTPVTFATQFWETLISRKHEYEADAYAKNNGYAEELGTALIKLSSENLSSTDTDWLYSSYHHSHPTFGRKVDSFGLHFQGQGL